MAVQRRGGVVINSPIDDQDLKASYANASRKQRQQRKQYDDGDDDDDDDDDEYIKEDKVRKKLRVTERADASTAATSILSIYDILRFVLSLTVASCALSYFVTGNGLFWGYRPWYTRMDNVKAWISGPVILTDADLAAYDGSDPTKPVYLALDGQIYDVSAGRHFYGPGGSYHFFAGRDAARAFVTGCFQEDLTPDLRGVEEMYIPLREDAPLLGEEGERNPEAEKEVRRQEKIAREREKRQAKKKVQSVIDGWAKTFRGDTGKPYFWVGVVERENGWLQNLPLKGLCEAAKKSRPKAKSHA